MANQLTGRILKIEPTQALVSKRTGQTFYKREIILDCTRYDTLTGERGIENTPVLEFTGDRCSQLDSFQVGQVVTVSFDIYGQKGSTAERYFNCIRGYKIELRPIQAQPQPVPQTSPQSANQPQVAQPMACPQPRYQQPTPNDSGLPF